MAPASSVQKVRLQKSLFSWTGAFLLTGVLLVLNFILSYVPIRVDTSEGKAYSLSRGTKDLLKKLDDPMVVRMFFSSDLPPQLRSVDRYIRDLLSEYRQASHGRIKVEFIDPGVSLKLKQEAIQAGVMPVQLNVLEKDKQEIKESFMGVAILYGDKKESISFIKDTQGLEYEITQRMKKLILPKDVTIGFVTNGRPMLLTDEPIRALSEPLNQLYNVVSVDLNQDIPSEVNALWLLGATEPLESSATFKLRKWVSEGGVLGVLVDRFKIDTQTFRPSPINNGLDELFKEWGVEVRPAFVVDPRCSPVQIRMTQGYLTMARYIEYPYIPMITEFDRTHPLTKNLDAVSLPFAAPIFNETPMPNLTYTPLAKSSKLSWIDPQGTTMSPLMDHAKPSDSPNGPFAVAMLVEGMFNTQLSTSTKTGRVILVGCSRFIRSDYPVNESNYNFFLNMLDWSVQDEFLLSIRSKGVAQRFVKELPDMTRLLFKYTLAGGLPILSILAGVVILSMSKKRRQNLPSRYRETMR